MNIKVCSCTVECCAPLTMLLRNVEVHPHTSVICILFTMSVKNIQRSVPFVVLVHRSPRVSGRGSGQGGVVPLSRHARPAIPLPAGARRGAAIFGGSSGRYPHSTALPDPGGVERVKRQRTGAVEVEES